MDVRLKALRQAIMEKREARRMLEMTKASGDPRRASLLVPLCTTQLFLHSWESLD